MQVGRLEVIIVREIGKIGGGAVGLFFGGM